MAKTRKSGKSPRAKSGARASTADGLHESLYKGFQYYRSGQLLEAGDVFHRILQTHPDNPDALLSLGVILLEIGNQAAAMKLMTQAIAVKPNYTEAHFNLGNVFQVQGRLEEAAISYRRSLELKPDWTEAHFNLARVLQDQGKLEEAANGYRHVLDLRPGWAEAQLNLGSVLEAQELLEDAQASYERALSLRPDWAEAHFNLANALRLRGQLEEAVAGYRRALVLRLERPEVYLNLGNALRALKKTEDAVASYRRALALKPDWDELQSALGEVLAFQGDFEEAEQLFRQLLIYRPDWHEAHINLGYTFEEQGQFASALESYQTALQLDPGSAQAHYNRANVWLLTGNLTQGWAEYEWRWRTSFFASMTRIEGPDWDGYAPLVDRTILLHAEQGLGDTIHFIRYAPLVKALGAEVVVGCHASLKSLLESCPGIDRVVAHDEPAPTFDLHVPLMSLPYLLNTDLESIPSDVPYLHAPDHHHLPEEVQTRLNTTGLKVGLVWTPGLLAANARKRHCPLEHFEPVLEVEGVSFFSLYKGERMEELAPYRERVFDVGSQCTDFADTARAIAQLDLVITVDTAVAHLAGAMGKPTWVLLPFVPDWRWLLEREDSPWYPTARLFRQHRLGEWAPVLEQVAQSLHRASREASGQSGSSHHEHSPTNFHGEHSR